MSFAAAPMPYPLNIPLHDVDAADSNELDFTPPSRQGAPEMAMCAAPAADNLEAESN